MKPPRYAGQQMTYRSTNSKIGISDLNRLKAPQQLGFPHFKKKQFRIKRLKEPVMFQTVDSNHENESIGSRRNCWIEDEDVTVIDDLTSAETRAKKKRGFIHFKMPRAH